jgi:hypothetical protein
LTGYKFASILYFGGFFEQAEWKGIHAVAKGKSKDDQKKKSGTPGSGGLGAGAGRQGVSGGGGGGQPGSQPPRWEFDLSTEGVEERWKGRSIWGKTDHAVIYVESTDFGSLGRVPAAEASAMKRELDKRGGRGRLEGEILSIKSSRLITVVLMLV